jgi:hypothetical protein
MSKVMLASGSFTVGVCFALAISAGIQTPTWAQVVISGGSLSGNAGGGVANRAAEPTVPAVRMIQLDGTKLLGNQVQSLDGIDCEQCTISAATLTYAGGTYRLNGTASGMRLVLKGPAANTFALLNQLGAFRKPPARIMPPSPFKPPAFLETKADTITIEIHPVKSPTAVTLTSLSK